MRDGVEGSPSKTFFICRMTKTDLPNNFANQQVQFFDGKMQYARLDTLANDKSKGHKLRQSEEG